ncbi:hypothetical protein ACFLW8_03945 [Chloroflexota bacterium]
MLILWLARFNGLANTLFAWAMLVLAFTLFMALRHNIGQERRRWKAEQLKEIMNWVDDVLKYCAIYSYDIDDANKYQSLIAVTELKLMADYIMSLAEGFDTSLREPLEKASRIFYQVFDKLQQEETKRGDLEERCAEVKKAIAALRNK